MTSNSANEAVLEPRLPNDCTIKLVGLGGVGNIVARYLSVFLASVNWPVRLVCVDGDSFEPANATRMLFSRCGNKAAVLTEELREMFFETDLSLLAVEEYITGDNIESLIQNGDIVLLAVDNHATRKLVSDYCSHLQDVVLISGGNDGIETDASGRQLQGTYGNCQIHIRRGGQDRTPSLTRYHREIANPADSLPTDKSCTELLASVPQILFANVTTASAILNAFWLHLCGALEYSELAFDISKGLMRPVPLQTS